MTSVFGAWVVLEVGEHPNNFQVKNPRGTQDTWEGGGWGRGKGKARARARAGGSNGEGVQVKSRAIMRNQGVIS